MFDYCVPGTCQSIGPRSSGSQGPLATGTLAFKP
jgi:hypothetical protein